jgi:DNA excision repair protein ERCC-2
MAIASSKKFLRTMAQPFEQSSKSLWGIEEVLEKQRKDSGFVQEDDDDDDMEAEYGEIDEEALMRELEG